MTTLYLHLNGVLQLSMNGSLVSMLEDYSRFQRVGPTEDELIFYDWIADDSGKVCGIEFHVTNEHPYLTALCDKPYVTFEPFPRILFRPVVTPHPRGVEAFGELSLFAGNDGSWLLAVGVDNWLDSADVCELKRLCSNS